MAFDAATARVTLPATAANLRVATELLYELPDADPWATAVAAITNATEQYRVRGPQSCYASTTSYNTTQLRTRDAPLHMKRHFVHTMQLRTHVKASSPLGIAGDYVST